MNSHLALLAFVIPEQKFGSCWQKFQVVLYVGWYRFEERLITPSDWDIKRIGQLHQNGHLVIIYEENNCPLTMHLTSTI